MRILVPSAPWHLVVAALTCFIFTCPNGATAAHRYKVKDARPKPGDGTRIRNKKDGYVTGWELTGKTFDYHGKVADVEKRTTKWPWGYANTPNMCGFAELEALAAPKGYPKTVKNRCNRIDKRNMRSRHAVTGEQFATLVNASPCAGRKNTCKNHPKKVCKMDSDCPDPGERCHCPGNCCDGTSCPLVVNNDIDPTTHKPICPSPIRLYSNYFKSKDRKLTPLGFKNKYRVSEKRTLVDLSPEPTVFYRYIAKGGEAALVRSPLYGWGFIDAKCLPDALAGKCKYVKPTTIAASERGPAEPLSYATSSIEGAIEDGVCDDEDPCTTDYWDAEDGCVNELSASCMPDADTCINSDSMYAMVSIDGNSVCDGLRSEVRGSVRISRSTGILDSLKITVELQGATPESEYAIEVLEAGTCGDVALADTDESVFTDASGSGAERFWIDLPWSPFGTDALGDGLGSEAAVVILEEIGDDGEPTGVRYVSGESGIALCTPPPCSFVTDWGRAGTDNDPPHLRNAEGIGVDSNGNVYVADSWYIKKFDPAGSFLTSWGQFVSGAPGGFAYAHGVAVDSNNCSVFATDGHDTFAPNHRVQKFDCDGNFITQWGRQTGTNFGSNPLGVAVDPSGNVFVADSSSFLLWKFTNDGTFLGSWGGFGSGPGQFAGNSPFGVAVDADGNVFATDPGNARVQKFDNSGNFITMWGQYGNGRGEFNGPAGTAVGSDGRLFVVDSGNSRIQIFDANGAFQAGWGTFGVTGVPGEFANPWGIAVNGNGEVYVTDNGNHRVQKFLCPK